MCESTWRLHLKPSIIDLAYQLAPEPLLLSVRTAEEPNCFTGIHFIEQSVGRPFRYLKRFTGQTKLNGTLVTTDTYYNCRLLVPNTEPDLSAPSSPLSILVGGGGIYSVPLRAFLEQYRQHLEAEPWYGLKGPVLSDEECAALVAQDSAACAPHEIVRTYTAPIKL